MLSNIFSFVAEILAYGSYNTRKFLTHALAERPRRVRGKRRLVTYGRVSHLYLYAIVLIYSEIVLRIVNHTGLFRHLIYPILFGLAYGAFFDILTTCFPKRVNRRITTVLLAVTGVIYCVEALIYNSYQTYMTFSAIMTGAGGVLTGYLSELIKSIIGGILPILLFLLPTILYVLWGKRVTPALRYKPYFAGVMFLVGMVLFLVAGFAAGHGRTAESYKSQYEFDTAVATFGLPTGLRLSLVRSEAAGGSFATEEVQTNAADPSDESEAPVVAETEEGEIPAEGETSVEGEAGAQEGTFTPMKPDKAENVMNIDFDEVMKNFTDADVAGVCQYVKSQTPSKTNEYTGLFKGKNLILICAEAFSDAVISKKLTPTLYRMIHNGFYFSDYYQPTWGGSTITGEMSLLTGLVPTDGVNTIYQTIGQNEYFTIGNQLQRLGYYNAAFHNGRYNYYERHTTHNNFGYGTWLAQHNGLEKLLGNYPSDEKMLVGTLELYANQQPFSVYYMTVDGHAAYKSSSKFVEANMDYVKANKTRDYKDTTLYYLCYQVQLEKAMKGLIEKLEELGIADDTVICLTADHYPYGLAKSSSWGNDIDYVADLYGGEDKNPWDRDHNAWILWSGCLENSMKSMAKEISAPTYSLDIVPTLSNLFGVEYDSRLLVGRDVFSDKEPLVLWPNGSWVTTKGKYNAKAHEYVSVKGGDDSEDYRKNIKNIVANKINYSKMVRKLDFWGMIFGDDNDTGDNHKGSDPLSPDSSAKVTESEEAGGEAEIPEEEMMQEPEEG